MPGIDKPAIDALIDVPSVHCWYHGRINESVVSYLSEMVKVFVDIDDKNDKNNADYQLNIKLFQSIVSEPPLKKASVK